ncbi:MAG TPA: hypothetical protein VLU47_03050 [Blastocatellia bacterium]|nr:hypothetical protein [Blastocatellia bacterium]
MSSARFPFRFLTLLIAASFGNIATAQNGAGEAIPEGVSFSYKFENPRFYVPLLEMIVRPDSSGELRFKRGESDEMLDLKFKLMPATLARIRQLCETSKFLTSDAEYQDKKDFSHLGWINLSAREGERSRKVRFNYTLNPEIRELADIFRGIATQEIHVFDMETAQQYQPLDLPGRLDALQNDLRLERLAEPERMLAPLLEIAGDDTQPLIARNQANRIIEGIKKGKFKSPVKTGQ